MTKDIQIGWRNREKYILEQKRRSRLKRLPKCYAKYSTNPKCPECSWRYNCISATEKIETRLA